MSKHIFFHSRHIPSLEKNLMSFRPLIQFNAHMTLSLISPFFFRCQQLKCSMRYQADAVWSRPALLFIIFNYFSKSKAYIIVTNTIRYLLSLHKKWVTFKTSAICWLLCWILFKKTKCNIFKRFSCENVYCKNVKKISFKDIFVIVWNFFNLNSQTCANPTLSTYFPWSPW